MVQIADAVAPQGYGLRPISAAPMIRNLYPVPETSKSIAEDRSPFTGRFWPNLSQRKRDFASESLARVTIAPKKT